TRRQPRGARRHRKEDRRNIQGAPTSVPSQSVTSLTQRQRRKVTTIMQPNNPQEEQTYGGQSFAPRDFNARTQEPEAAEGEYTVTIQNAKFRVTPPDRGSDPQVNMQLKITATASDDESAEKSIGGTLFDAITFFAPGSRSRLS